MVHEKQLQENYKEKTSYARKSSLNIIKPPDNKKESFTYRLILDFKNINKKHPSIDSTECR